MIDTGEFLDIIKRENLIHKDKHLIKEGETPKYIPVPNVDKLFKLNYKKRFFIDWGLQSNASGV